jgi:hypothetical protein
MRDSQRSVTPENPPWAQSAQESSPYLWHWKRKSSHARQWKDVSGLGPVLCRSRRQHGFLVLDVSQSIRE